MTVLKIESAFLTTAKPPIFEIQNKGTYTINWVPIEVRRTIWMTLQAVHQLSWMIFLVS